MTNGVLGVMMVRHGGNMDTQDFINRDYCVFRVNEADFPFELKNAHRYFKIKYGFEADIVVVNTKHAEFSEFTRDNINTNEIWLASSQYTYLPRVTNDKADELALYMRTEEDTPNKKLKRLGKTKGLLPEPVREPTMKRRRGRPKGSKNRIKI